MLVCICELLFPLLLLLLSRVVLGRGKKSASLKGDRLRNTNIEKKGKEGGSPPAKWLYQGFCRGQRGDSGERVNPLVGNGQGPLKGFVGQKGGFYTVPGR